MAASHLKIWLLSLFAIAGNTVSALEVGDIVCVQGYVMDYYCIDNGDMIDNGKPTLEEPFDHTVHCLVDVSLCYNSPFEVLTDPVSSGTLYTRGYRLTEDSKEEVLSVARSVGSCGTCVNGYDSSMLNKGFRAVMIATVLDLNLDDDDAPPLITIDAMKPSNDLGDDPCQTEYDIVEGVPAASPVTTEPTKRPTPFPTPPPTKESSASPVTDTPTAVPTSPPTMKPVTNAPDMGNAPPPTSEPSASPVTDTPTAVPTSPPTMKPVTNAPDLGNALGESSDGETLSLKQFHAIACFIISAVLL